jgi:hypothetical protein
MKKLFVIALAFLATTAAFAQNDTAAAKQPVKAVPLSAVNQASTPTNKPAKKDWSKINLKRRANDHFVFQFGYDGWAGRPDSIHTTGINRSANFYFMLDFPFKTDPRFSIGAGLGIGTSNIYFNKQKVLVAATGNPTLAFPDLSGTDHFKKFKLVTTYVEAPIELRFAVDPENTNKSWKFALGMKVGLMLSAYTKGKTLQNNAGQTLSSYTEKESSTHFFNTTRLAGTARISKGPIGLFGQMQVTGLIKNGYGPTILPFTIGVQISGL